ncbi:hypothetical protein GCM10022408_03820 [Hymenobacter fastidiosus]|uniref:Uncharacterized protein n=1 Tax=Hymenobacter fastidiosus TaxID=486264 RepID=A0ABP7REV1_9BACT
MDKIPVLLVAGLLLAGGPVRAQAADIAHHGSITGLNDPEPADPRYLPAHELARLKASAWWPEPVVERQKSVRPARRLPKRQLQLPGRLAPTALPDSVPGRP